MPNFIIPFSPLFSRITQNPVLTESFPVFRQGNRQNSEIIAWRNLFHKGAGQTIFPPFWTLTGSLLAKQSCLMDKFSEIYHFVIEDRKQLVYNYCICAGLRPAAYIKKYGGS